MRKSLRKIFRLLHSVIQFRQPVRPLFSLPLIRCLPGHHSKCSGAEIPFPLRIPRVDAADVFSTGILPGFPNPGQKQVHLCSRSRCQTAALSAVHNDLFAPQYCTKDSARQRDLTGYAIVRLSSCPIPGCITSSCPLHRSRNVPFNTTKIHNNHDSAPRSALPVSKPDRRYRK